MSRENVEIVRRSYAAFNRGDWDAALEAARPEIEWRLHGDLGIDAPPLVPGREGVRAQWADFFEVWEDHRMDHVIRGGSIASVDVYADRGQALEAAGAPGNSERR